MFESGGREQLRRLSSILDLGVSSTCAFWELTKGFLSVLIQLLVSTCTVQKVLPRPVLKVPRAWTFAARGLMGPPHKANFRRSRRRVRGLLEPREDQLLVSAGTRQKGLHVGVWRVHLAWTLAERAFRWLPFKGNFHTFLDVGFKAPRHFLESPKGTFWSPPLRKSHFSDEAFKKGLQAGVRAEARTRSATCLSPARLHGGCQLGGLGSPAHKHKDSAESLV